MNIFDNSTPPQRGSEITRRRFLRATGLLTLSAAAGCQTNSAGAPEPIIDIHQHLHYQNRSDEVFFAHQKAMGITRTILLPAGRSVDRPSTNNGESNGLEAKCAGNEDCYLLARANKRELLFGANEVPDVPEAIKEIETYLKLGGVVIGEQKFRLECDSPQMQRIYQLAAHYHVPVLMHWQYQRYNLGFDRFYKMLEKYPRTLFVGHAQTWWANIDRNYKDDAKNLYPKTKVTPGGLTDSYLRDYPNMFGDLSAGSGLNSLKRDEDHAREFLHRHQDKLIYGSDCDDHFGYGDKCQGAQTIAMIRKLVPEPKIRKKLFWSNARRVFRI
jgi:predicted TIM-barrel fold metal-dependent hydrolase